MLTPVRGFCFKALRRASEISRTSREDSDPDAASLWLRLFRKATAPVVLVADMEPELAIVVAEVRGTVCAEKLWSRSVPSESMHWFPRVVRHWNTEYGHSRELGMHRTPGTE